MCCAAWLLPRSSALLSQKQAVRRPQVTRYSRRRDRAGTPTASCCPSLPMSRRGRCCALRRCAACTSPCRAVVRPQQHSSHGAAPTSLTSRRQRRRGRSAGWRSSARLAASRGTAGARRLRLPPGRVGNGEEGGSDGGSRPPATHHEKIHALVACQAPRVGDRVQASASAGCDGEAWCRNAMIRGEKGAGACRSLSKGSHL